MNEQNHLRELLPLYDSDELTSHEREQLEAWLREDAAARAELAALRAVQQKLETAEFYEPEPHTLHRLRDRLFENVAAAQRRPAWQERWREFWRPSLRPVWQFAWAMAMLLCGILVGRQFFAAKETATPVAMDLAPLLLAQQPIMTPQSVFAPRLANVHKIRFDQNTQQIEIEFSTVNEVSWRGTTDDPVVRQVLAHAMRTEESPGLRLRAVRAMGDAARVVAPPDDELLDALLQLLAADSNPGVRIKAVQTLKHFTGNERVKQALLRVLLHDANAGVRIQALEVLSTTKFNEEKIEALEAAANDTNDYIRREAGKLLQTVGSGTLQ